MKSIYENPLVKRYSSNEMLEVFSPDKKFKTWRKLWVSLAKNEKKLGLNITSEQIKDLEKYKDDIDYKVVEKREKEVRHDVMSHIYAYGLKAKKAAPIIHLGATSAFVGDNTDLIVQKDALLLIKKKLLLLIKNLADLSLKYKDLPMLGYTHLQPAQLVTLGKRFSLYLQDFYFDYLNLESILKGLPFLGVKGTTGTMASFLKLFDGNTNKCFALEKAVAKDFEFEQVVSVSGQTYTRKIDDRIADLLSEIAVSSVKFTNDIRILASLKEVEEPFEKNQVGSSAMAYKRNPMRSERVSSLSKFVISNAQTLKTITMSQWFERTLDDSAARRIVIPECFLAIDANLDILKNITEGIVVYKNVINEHIKNEIPFMATENILMEAVKRGGNRQTLHEKIRKYSLEASHLVKEKGKKNNLLEKIVLDKDFKLTKKDIENLTDPKQYIGLSKTQVEKFIKEKINPIFTKLDKKILKTKKVDLRV